MKTWPSHRFNSAAELGFKLIIPGGARQLSLPGLNLVLPSQRMNPVSIGARWDMIDSSSMQQDGSGP